MASPDFSEFGRPSHDTGKPGVVVCLDCRGEVAKEETRFEARETGYLCHDCVAARRRRFLAKAGTVALGVVGGVVVVVLRVMRATYRRQ